MSNAFSVIWTLYLTLDCFAVHGSNLRWQVTKIIRHLQTCRAVDTQYSCYKVGDLYK